MKKIIYQILMRETCLGFFNIEVFYGSCNVGCFWWIFTNITFMLYIPKSSCDLHKYFRFSPQLLNIIRNCVKEQWPKIFFLHFWLFFKDLISLLIDNTVSIHKYHYTYMNVRHKRQLKVKIKWFGQRSLGKTYWNCPHLT